MEIRDALRNLLTLFVAVLGVEIVAGVTGTTTNVFINQVNQAYVDLNKIVSILNNVLVPVTTLVFTIGGFWIVLEIIGADKLLQF